MDWRKDWRMDWRDALLMIYSSTPALKACAYLLTLLAVTLFSGHLLGLLWLGLPLAVDAYGAWIIKENMPAFQEDVLFQLETACLAACGIDKAAPHYPFHTIGGSLDHWTLRDQKTQVSYTMMAPKDQFVVIAERRGRIFPLKSYLNPAYHIEDAGTRDVYYADIAAVEVSGSALTMKLAAGGDVAYTGQGPKAAEAALMLRRRVREFKAGPGRAEA